MYYILDVQCTCVCIRIPRGHHQTTLYFLLATKQDSWIAINPLTGNKLYSFGSEGMEETCPVDDTNTNILHIPQTGK